PPSAPPASPRTRSIRCSCAIPGPSSRPPGSSRRTRMRSAREVILAWVDAFNRRAAEAAAALYHDDSTNLQVAIGQPLVGRAAILEDLRAFFRAFPAAV